MSRNNLKSARFSKVFSEYLINGSTDFYQTYVIFRQLPIVSSESKRLKTIIPFFHGNQIMKKCWAKNYQREKKWHFSEDFVLILHF